jgi:hypothetical protein
MSILDPNPKEYGVLPVPVLFPVSESKKNTGSETDSESAAALLSKQSFES